MLPNYLIATWAKICQALGPGFEPFLPVVMPPLLNAASAKADVSIYSELFYSCCNSHLFTLHCCADEDDEVGETREGWETISMDGQIVGIRTSTIDEKCQAFDTLVVYCATLGGRFAPYLTQSLELSLPALKFYFHDGVREAASRCVLSSHLTLTTCIHAYHRLIPLLFTCGKQSGTLTSPMVVIFFSVHIIQGFVPISSRMVMPCYVNSASFMAWSARDHLTRVLYTSHC
jgi:hypothetical protein